MSNLQLLGCIAVAAFFLFIAYCIGYDKGYQRKSYEIHIQGLRERPSWRWSDDEGPRDS